MSKIKLILEKTANEIVLTMTQEEHDSFISLVTPWIQNYKLLTGTDISELTSLTVEPGEDLTSYYDQFKFKRKHPNWHPINDKSAARVLSSPYDSLLDLFLEPNLPRAAGSGAIIPPRNRKSPPAKPVVELDIEDLLEAEAKELSRQLESLGLNALLTGTEKLGGRTKLTTKPCDNPAISSAAGALLGTSPHLLIRGLGTGMSQAQNAKIDTVKRLYGEPGIDSSKKSFVQRAKGWLKTVGKLKLIGSLGVGTAFVLVVSDDTRQLVSKGLETMYKEPKKLYQIVDTIFIDWERTNTNPIDETSGSTFVLNPCFAAAFIASFAGLSLIKGLKAARTENFIDFLKKPSKNVDMKTVESLFGGPEYKETMRQEFESIQKYLNDILSSPEEFSELSLELTKKLLDNDAAFLKDLIFNREMDPSLIQRLGSMNDPMPDIIIENIKIIRNAREEGINNLLRGQFRTVSDTLGSNLEFFKIFDMELGERLTTKQVGYLKEILKGAQTAHKKTIKKSLEKFRQLKLNFQRNGQFRPGELPTLYNIENRIDEVFEMGNDAFDANQLAAELVNLHRNTRGAANKKIVEKLIDPNTQELTKLGKEFLDIHKAKSEVLREIDRYELESMSFLDFMGEGGVPKSVANDIRDNVSKTMEDVDTTIGRIGLNATPDEVRRALKLSGLPFAPEINIIMKARKALLVATATAGITAAPVLASMVGRILDGYYNKVPDINSKSALLIHDILDAPEKNEKRVRIVEKAISILYTQMAVQFGENDDLSVDFADLPLSLERTEENQQFGNLALNLHDTVVAKEFGINQDDKSTIQAAKAILTIITFEYFKNPHPEDPVATKNQNDTVTKKELMAAAKFFAQPRDGRSSLGVTHYKALFEKSYNEVKQNVRSFAEKAERARREAAAAAAKDKRKQDASFQNLEGQEISRATVLIIGDSTANNLIATQGTDFAGTYNRFAINDKRGGLGKDLGLVKDTSVGLPGYTKHVALGAAQTDLIYKLLEQKMQASDFVIPKTAIISMGYNDIAGAWPKEEINRRLANLRSQLGIGTERKQRAVQKKINLYEKQLKNHSLPKLPSKTIPNFEKTIELLIRKGVKDIRIVGTKTSTRKQQNSKSPYHISEDVARQLSLQLSILSNRYPEVLFIPNELDSAGKDPFPQFDGVHFTGKSAKNLLNVSLRGAGKDVGEAFAGNKKAQARYNIYATEIRRIANDLKTAPELVAGVIHAESNFAKGIVSKAEAVGLMQLMQITAKDVRNRKDLWKNLPKEYQDIFRNFKTVQQREVEVGGKIIPKDPNAGDPAYDDRLNATKNIATSLFYITRVIPNHFKTQLKSKRFSKKPGRIDWDKMTDMQRLKLSLYGFHTGVSALVSARFQNGKNNLRLRGGLGNLDGGENQEKQVDEYIELVKDYHLYLTRKYKKPYAYAEKIINFAKALGWSESNIPKLNEEKIMDKNNLRKIVSEMLRENTGMGYSDYPYQSNEYDEEEPDQDYQVEWSSFVDEVCGPRKKAVDGDPKTFEDTAIEVAKLFVKDSDLFRDVLELAGNNKSLGTEILRQLKEAREKQE